MVNSKAQAAKDSGNVAFKSGDYPTAIGHYTSAILANQNDVTYPLNRAAAYLKLGKNEDAERDCNRVLELSPNNVKALFRRSQAKIGMGNLTEAHKDLLKVLKVEPSNQSAQEELKKVASLIEKEKSKKSNQVPISPMQASLESSSAIKRRRVPIKIIEPPSAVTSATSSAAPVPNPSKPHGSLVVESSPRAVQPVSSNARTDTLEPVSSRSLKLPGTDASSGNSKVSLTTGRELTDNDKETSLESRTPPTPILPSPASSTSGASKLNSFKDAKQARESAKPSRVGGGIFRASGSNTLFTPRDNGNPPLADPPKKSESSASTSFSIRPSAKDDSNSKTSYTPPVPKAPNTLFDFVKSWGSLRSTEEKWQLINSIPPAHFPALCKTSLEPSMLVSIMETFLAKLEVTKGDDFRATKTIIQDYMENFERIPRFNTLVLFLSKSEKSLAKSVWKAVDVDQPTGTWSGVM